MVTVVRHVVGRMDGTDPGTTTQDFRVSGGNTGGGGINIFPNRMKETPNAAIIFTTGNSFTANPPETPRPVAQMSIGLVSKHLGVVNKNMVQSLAGTAGASTVDVCLESTTFAAQYTLASLRRLELLDFLPDNGRGAGAKFTRTGTGSADDVIIDCIFFHCAAATAGSFSLPGSLWGTVTETLTFRPDLIIFTSCGTPGASSVDFHISYGACDSEFNQRCYVIAENSGEVAGSPVFQAFDSRAMADINVTTGASISSMEVTDITATGFEVTQRDSATSTATVNYLALRLSPSRSRVFGISSRTSAGTQTITTPNFTPQMVLHTVSAAEAYNTAYTSALAGHLGVNIYDGRSEQQELFTYHVGVTIEDAAGTTNTNSTTSTTDSTSDDSVGYDGNSYQDDGTVEAEMTFSPLQTGFSLEYATAPASTKRWWAIAIQEPVIATNPPVKRMYSLLHGLSLSAIVRESPLSSIQNFLRSDLSYRMTGYSHEIGADGGYISARLSFAATRSEAMEWVGQGVAKELVVYNEGQQIAWIGIVDSIDAAIGGVSYSSGSLMDVATRIAVAYRRRAYGVGGTSIGGQERTTDVADNTDQQDLLGILQELINGGESTSAAAEQLRDSLLAELAYLQPGQQVDFVGGSDISVTLNCIGYTTLLDKFLYESTVSGEINASDKIQDVLNADPNALFTDFTDIDTNTFQVPDEDDGQNKGGSVISSVVAYGDASDNRWIAGSLYNRRFYYRQIPNTPELVLYLSDAGFSLRDVRGARVYPWNATPGLWFIVPDLALSNSFPSTVSRSRSDRRATFVERVSFTAPYGLQLGGGRVSTINQRLAKLGLGNI